jgi:hypothetical protein
MLTTSKIKWFGSIILAGILLALALMGGKWGTTYSVSASVNVAPVIDSIDPSAVPAGSPDTLLLINGSNFGTLADTKVRLTGSSIVQLLTPIEISPNQISVIIPAALLAVPQVYTLEVIVYIGGTVPGEEISNSVRFTVYSPFNYLPIIYKDYGQLFTYLPIIYK